MNDESQWVIGQMSPSEEGGAITPVFATPEMLPVITTVTPNQARRGESVQVVITGRHLRDGATITFHQPGISAGNVVVSNDGTQATAELSIAFDARLGNHTLILANRHAFSATAPFEVLSAPPPEITSISPAHGFPGETVTVALSGLNFQPGATLSSTLDLQVSDVEIHSRTQATAQILIPDSAPVDSATLRLTNPDGQYAEAAFRVELPTDKADLVGVWERFTVRTLGKGKKLRHVLKGRLVVQNIGAITAGKSAVRLFVSNDELFDAGDAPLTVQKGNRGAVPVELKVNALKRGQRVKKSIIVTLKPDHYAPHQGKYVIAVLDYYDQVDEAREANVVVATPALP